MHCSFRENASINACTPAARGPAWRLRPIVAALAAGIAFLPQASVAQLPVGPDIVQGTADISVAAQRMDIANSPGAVLNWQGFSIGAGSTVHFAQQNTASQVLNRVVGEDPSHILGTLSSNGRVWLLNPNGVLFGADARIDVAGLVASTLRLSDQDFADGHFRFARDADAGFAEVLNRGEITTTLGGRVWLLGHTVRNEGLVQTPGGELLIAAGEQIELLDSAVPELRVIVSAADNKVTNLGQLLANEGGRVDVLGGIVNQSGVVRADTARMDAQGRVTLKAQSALSFGVDSLTTANATGEQAVAGTIAAEADYVALGGSIGADGLEGASGGAVNVVANQRLSLAQEVSARSDGAAGGTVSYRSEGGIVETSTSHTDVSGATSGGRVRVVGGGSVLSSGTYDASATDGAGGRIDLTGGDVRLLSAALDASGSTEGGTVRVGGAFQGGKPGAQDDPVAARFSAAAMDALPNARTTFINDGSRIDVSSASGVAGSAVVWSDQQTTQLGAVDARGGAGAGAVEISSGEVLRHASLKNVLTGSGGLVLIDPKNLTIADSPEVESDWLFQALITDDGFPDISFNRAISLNSAGDRLAIGNENDAGFLGDAPSAGAVSLFSFTNGDFEGATLEAIIGLGYQGGKNLNLAGLTAGTSFGRAVSLNASGDRLAVGSNDDGADDLTPSGGAVALFSFADNIFNGGQYDAIIGSGYAGGKNISVDLDGRVGFDFEGDFFGLSVALNGSGNLLAVGAPGDAGFDNSSPGSGAVYLFQFSDSDFSGGTLAGILGKGYLGTASLDIQTAEGSFFGESVALNTVGNHLAVGVSHDAGANADPDDPAYGAVKLFAFADGAFGGGRLAGTIGRGYSTGNDLNLPLVPGEVFGTSVALNGTGDILAVGAVGNMGADFVDPTPGAAYLFRFGSDGFADGELLTLFGRGYTGAGRVDVPLVPDEYFGAGISLNSTGDRLLVATDPPPVDGELVTSLYAFRPATGGGVIAPEGARFGLNSEGDASVLSSEVSAALQNGASVRLQANNDITVTAQIAAIAPAGTELALQAGRSVLINANIDTGNADLSITANETLANGVVEAQRDAGAAVVAMASGTRIDAGSGAVRIALADGAGKSRASSGDITLGAIDAGSILVENLGVTDGSGVALLPGAQLVATAPGDAIVLAGDRFLNDAGPSALSTPAGRWLIHSFSQDQNRVGGLAYDFIQFDAPYSVAVPAQTNNGLLYASTVEILGTVERTYDGTLDARIDDSVLFSGQPTAWQVAVVGEGGGRFDEATVGAGRPIVVDVEPLLSVTEDGVPVYGTRQDYVGNIVPAELTVTANDDEKAFDGFAYFGGKGVTVEGLVQGETEAVLQGELAYGGSSQGAIEPGSYTISARGLTSANYAVSFVDGRLQISGESPEPAPADLLAGVPDSSVFATDVAVEAALGGMADPSSAGSGGIVDPIDAGDDFGTINLAQLTREQIEELLESRRRFKQKLFADGIYKLTEDPALADVRPCPSVADIASGLCRITDAQREEVRARIALERQTYGGLVKISNVPQIARKIAVLIGNNDYQDRTIPSLINAIPDAEAVGKLMEDQLGYEVRILRNAGKADMVKLFNELATEVNPADSVTVYYAGHGFVNEKTRAGYWIPTDAAATEPSEWLSNDDVSRFLSAIEAKQVALISDSCYSGSFAREQEMVLDGQSRSIDALLSRRSVVAMSSGGDEPVSDEGKDGQSVFAWNLIRALKNVKAWEPGVDIFEEVQVEVRKMFPQTPQYGALPSAGHQAGGDYLFEYRVVDRSQPGN